MISKEKQLENKANFVDEEGNLFLVRCMNCGDAYGGRENWANAVSGGSCVWCGWAEELVK